MAKRAKPSRERFFCWKEDNGRLKWVAKGSGFTMHKKRARLLRAADAADLVTHYGVSCKRAKYNVHKGQLGYVYQGTHHTWKAKRRGR